MATKWERKVAMAAIIRELTLSRSKEKFEIREPSLRRPKEKYELQRESKSKQKETKSNSEKELRKNEIEFEEKVRKMTIAVRLRLLKLEDKNRLLAEFVESLGGISEEEKTELTAKLRESKSVRAVTVSIAKAILAGGENSMDDDPQTPVEFPPINDYDRQTLEIFVSPLKDELRLLRAWSLILVRLPPHDLQRFKLVCRLWRSIISSPGFASAHFSFSKSNPTSHSLLVHEANPQGVRAPSRSIVYCFSFSPVDIVGSANGLICAVNKSPYCLCVLNPVTGHILKLPVPSSASSRFDYRTDSVAFVFWCDDDDGEYNLAKIVSKPDNTTVASLWASGSPETWTEIAVGFKGSFHNPLTVSGCDIVIWDVAYWIVFEHIDDYSVGKLFVMSLDLKTLSLSINENPFPLHFMKPEALCERLLCSDNSYLFAANWKGKFSLVERDREKKVHNVWTMDDDVEGGWRMSSSFAEEFRIKRCLTTSINGKSILTRVVGRNRIGISSFDVGTGEGEMIEGYRLGKCVTSAHDFVESLVSIKGFKPPEAYGLTRHPRLRVVYPCPSFCFENEEKLKFDPRLHAEIIKCWKKWNKIYGLTNI